MDALTVNLVCGLISAGLVVAALVALVTWGWKHKDAGSGGESPW